MAQRHSTPTLSKSKVSDQRFAAGHESSPKNDISCSLVLISAHLQLKALRNDASCVEKGEKVDVKPVGHLERLQNLKMFSRGKSSLQKEDVAELKKQRLDETLKTQFPELGQRVFCHHEIYDLLIELDAYCSMGAWRIRENPQEIIVYAHYGSVFPGLRFKKLDDTYRCAGFNFNIRLAS